jgi:hypothetical protein
MSATAENRALLPSGGVGTAVVTTENRHARVLTAVYLTAMAALG